MSRRLKRIRIGLYFDDGSCAITKSPEKTVKIGARTKIGWFFCLLGIWIVFGNSKKFETVLNPLWPEPKNND